MATRLAAIRYRVRGMVELLRDGDAVCRMRRVSGSRPWERAENFSSKAASALPMAASRAAGEGAGAPVRCSEIIGHILQGARREMASRLVQAPGDRRFRAAERVRRLAVAHVLADHQHDGLPHRRVEAGKLALHPGLPVE